MTYGDAVRYQNGRLPNDGQALPDRLEMVDRSKEDSTDRLEAISDGVYSVAMTLLVLDIRVPDSNGILAAELTAIIHHGERFYMAR